MIKRRRLNTSDKNFECTLLVPNHPYQNFMVPSDNEEVINKLLEYFIVLLVVR